MKHALTLDIEDWHHPELVGRHVRGEKVDRVEAATDRLLELLDEFGVKATCFVLGDVARRHPELIRRVHDQGHEIASHGMSHQPLWAMDRAAFDAELKAFDALMREILGADFKAQGFRAPTFSLDQRTAYALSCLADNGYVYDSSIFPARNFLYGVDDAPCGLYRPNLKTVHLEDPASPLVEFPMTVYVCAGKRVPISGGVYLRVLPGLLVRALLARVARERPFILYLHPWETDPGTPRVRSIGWSHYFFTYYGIHGARTKLRNLLRRFEFGRAMDIVAEYNAAHPQSA